MIRELFERYENIEGPGALPHITEQSWEWPRIPGEIIYETTTDWVKRPQKFMPWIGRGLATATN